MPIVNTRGTASSKAFGYLSNAALAIDYLVVAGGGGGGYIRGGGGGAGGMLTGSGLLAAG